VGSVTAQGAQAGAALRIIGGTGSPLDPIAIF
jgi:hypothetical protein